MKVLLMKCYLKKKNWRSKEIGKWWESNVGVCGLIYNEIAKHHDYDKVSYVCFLLTVVHDGLRPHRLFPTYCDIKTLSLVTHSIDRLNPCIYWSLHECLMLLCVVCLYWFLLCSVAIMSLLSSIIFNPFWAPVSFFSLLLLPLSLPFFEIKNSGPYEKHLPYGRCVFRMDLVAT